uniref:Uncharacterized protein n=1 Tax=Rhizophora mucronata TaxID=61149 RepID=A0A2P2PMI2_RHIMU
MYKRTKSRITFSNIVFLSPRVIRLRQL